jgi:hypothetical protein
MRLRSLTTTDQRRSNITNEITLARIIQLESKKYIGRDISTQYCIMNDHFKTNKSHHCALKASFYFNILFMNKFIGSKTNT